MSEAVLEQLGGLSAEQLEAEIHRTEERGVLLRGLLHAQRRVEVRRQEQQRCRQILEGRERQAGGGR